MSKSTDPRVRIVKMEPRRCDVCQSTDVWFHVSYRDRLNPPNDIRVKLAGGGHDHIVPDNDHAISCRQHVAEVCAIVLNRNGLMPEVSKQEGV